MSGSPKQPKPIDPNVAAEAQARWSRFDTRGPGGSVTWQGSGPDATQVTEWSPELQQLFSSGSGIANQQRQQYAAPTGFADYRDRLMSNMNDRQSQGRPIYQPTQRFDGQLGAGGSGGAGSGGGAGGGMATGPGEGGMWDGSGGPSGPSAPVSAQVAMLPFGPGGMKPGGMKPGGMDQPQGKPMTGIGGMQPDPTTQPVSGPGDKSLTSGIASMLGGKPTATPWRDAFLGPVGADGERHTARHLLTGGLQGSVGRGIGNMLANREARKPSIDRQLGQIGQALGNRVPSRAAGQDSRMGPNQPWTVPNYGGNGSIPSAPYSGAPSLQAGQSSDQMGPNQPYTVPSYGSGGGPESGAKPTVPGKPAKPRGPRSTRLRTSRSLGYGNQIWGAGQDIRALAAMGLHDYTGMEQ